VSFFPFFSLCFISSLPRERFLARKCPVAAGDDVFKIIMLSDTREGELRRFVYTAAQGRFCLGAAQRKGGSVMSRNLVYSARVAVLLSVVSLLSACAGMENAQDDVYNHVYKSGQETFLADEYEF
jgi:hypothetical protein